MNARFSGKLTLVGGGTSPGPGRVEMEIYNAGNSHLGLTCTDLESEFNRLHAAGVEFQSPGVIDIPSNGE